jgi:hypothetical protein
MRADAIRSLESVLQTGAGYWAKTRVPVDTEPRRYRPRRQFPDIEPAPAADLILDAVLSSAAAEHQPDRDDKRAADGNLQQRGT